LNLQKLLTVCRLPSIGSLILLAGLNIRILTFKMAQKQFN